MPTQKQSPNHASHCILITDFASTSAVSHRAIISTFTRVTLFVVLAHAFTYSCARVIAADLGAIRAAVEERESAIESIRINYRLISKITLNCELLKDGTKVSLKTHSKEAGYEWSTYDGKYGYEMIFVPGSSTSLKSIRKTPSVPIAAKMLQTPLVWYGLSMPDLFVPLSSLLSTATLESESQINQWPVYNINLGDHGTKQVNCSLAPEFAYLPVRITMQRVGTSNPKEYLIDEVRDIEDSVLDRAIPFPWKMRAGEHIRIEVDKVELHPQTVAGDFIPKPEPSTVTIDESASGGSVISVQDPKLTREAALKVIMTNTTPPLAKPAVAVQPNSNWIFASFGLGSLFIIIAALYWNHRRG